MLILQPLAGKPLSLKYVGPYKILRKTSPVDYIVEFKGHSKVKRNLHVNMLKPYFTKQNLSMLSCKRMNVMIVLTTVIV